MKKYFLIREKAYCYQPPFFCKIDLDLIKKEREDDPLF